MSSSSRLLARSEDSALEVNRERRRSLAERLRRQVVEPKDVAAIGLAALASRSSRQSIAISAVTRLDARVSHSSRSSHADLFRLKSCRYLMRSMSFAYQSR